MRLSERRVHRGELRRTVSWFSPVHLAFEDRTTAGRWVCVGGEGDRPVHYWPGEHADLAAAMLAAARRLSDEAPDVWGRTVRTWEHMEALGAFVAGVGDMLRRTLKQEES